MRSVGSVPFTMAQHSAELLPFLLSHRPGRTEGKMLTRSCHCGSHVQPGSWLSRRQTSSWSGKCHTKGNSSLEAAIILDCGRLETRTLCCMPCVNILPGTVEWSHVMQVKYKLQAVVNNCDIICTLDFLSFSTALVNLLWYLLQWLAG